MSLCFRLPDKRCLYLKEENDFGDRCIAAKEMESEEDTRFWWFEDSENGVIRSVYDPEGCISYDDVPCYTSIQGSEGDVGSNNSSYKSDPNYDEDEEYEEDEEEDEKEDEEEDEDEDEEEDEDGEEDDDIIVEHLCSLVLKNFDDLDDLESASWRIDQRAKTVSLLNTDLVMDATSEYGRVCASEFDGGDNQLFTTECKFTMLQLITEDGLYLHNCADGIVRLSEELQGNSTNWFAGKSDILRCVEGSDKVLSVSSGYFTMEYTSSGDMYQGWILEDESIISILKPDLALKSKGDKICPCQIDDEDMLNFTVEYL